MGKILPFPMQRRRHQRVAISAPAALVHENGTVVTVTAINLSRGGLQVVADRYTSASLISLSDTLGQNCGPRMDAHFKLPLNAGLAKLDIMCRMAYISRLENDEYAIGLEFVETEPRTTAVLEQFLDEAALLEL